MSALLLNPVPVKTLTPQPTQTLAAVLHLLEIPVYPTEQVERFKRNFRLKIILKEMVLVAGFMAVGLHTILLSLMVFLWVAGHPLIHPIGMFVDGLAMLVLPFGIFLGGVLVFLAVIGIPQIFARTQWTVGPLISFHVPNEVSKVAYKIKNELYSCEFTVHQLATDPFLFVSFADEKYCIAHWDEPNFIDQ